MNNAYLNTFFNNLIVNKSRVKIIFKYLKNKFNVNITKTKAIKSKTIVNKHLYVKQIFVNFLSASSHFLVWYIDTL